MSHTTPASTPAVTPAPERELELDLVAPGAVAAVLAAIAAVFVGATRATVAAARIALAAAIEPARSWPEGAERARARAALAAKREAIEAVERALDAAPTVAQPIPVITGGYAKHGAGCLCTLCEGIRASATPPAAPALVSVPRRAQWAQIRVRNHALRGSWGALVEGARPVAGERLRVFRRNGDESPPQWVTEVVEDTSRGWLVAITDVAPTGAPAPIAALGTAPVAAPVEVEIDWSEPSDAAPVATSAAPVAVDAILDVDTGTALDASNTGTLEQALGAVTAQGNNIAASAAQGAAAHASRAVVGFRDPAQYLQALRNGGLQAHTRADYIARCKSAGLTFDESTLPPANAPTTNTAPSGGIVHKPAPGKNVFQMTKEEKREHYAKLKIAAETRAELGKIIDAGQLIAGAVAAGGFLQISWVGGGTTTVGKVREAFAARGLAYDAPTGPSSERHAGRAVDSLKSRGMDTARLPSADLPTGISARWLVGNKLTGKTVKAGDQYGTAALIVSLTDGDALQFDGDQQLADACRAHFTNATQHEVLRSEDLTAWYAATLKREHYGVKRAHNWYVPGGEADAARALSEALGALWGDHETMPVTTGADLAKSLTRGLTDEIAKVRKEYDAALTTAQERAAKNAASDQIATCAEANKRAARRGELQMSDAAIAATATAAADQARERANVSATVAARLLLDLGKIAARVEGYRTVLGEEATAGTVDAMRALRDTLEPLCSDGDQRAAMLELS